MKKTLQECKEIIAKDNGYDFYPKDKNLDLAGREIIKITDLANKMYYEQSEDKTEKVKSEMDKFKEKARRDAITIEALAIPCACSQDPTFKAMMDMVHAVMVLTNDVSFNHEF